MSALPARLGGRSIRGTSTNRSPGGLSMDNRRWVLELGMVLALVASAL
jgi:hypothetical protein